MLKKKVLILIFFLFVIGILLALLSNNIGKEQVRIIQDIKYLIPSPIKNFIKEEIFVHKYKNQLEKKIKAQNKIIDNAYNEVEKIFEYGNSFEFPHTDSELIEINDTKLLLSKFTLSPLKYTGPRAYIQYYNQNLFLINGNGDLFFISRENFEKRKLIFTKIKTNIKKIASENKNELIQVKDFLLNENYIYISYLNKKKEKCFENKVIRGDISFNEIYFDTFFSTSECRKESTPSVGGNLSKYKENKILLTIGDYYCYEREKLDFCKKNLPQSNKSFMGKIIALDENTKDFQIMSMGHRNSQGIFYDFEKDIIWSTDHGPKGGDEININIKPKDSIKNYGWPIASYGKHYEGPGLDEKYKIAPLNKSHSEFNFTEPLKFFTPAIGISQIIKINGFLSEKNDELLVGSLGFDLEEGDLSLHYFKLDLNNKILNQKIIPIKERIRDIEFIADLDLIILFLETNGSIAIIEKI